MEKIVKFSVLMSCYANDNAEYLDAAIASLFDSTVIPDEIVLVVDGYIPSEVENIIKKWHNQEKLNVCRVEENGGLGKALRYGLTICRNDLIARMDSDDLNQPTRFEAQIEAFQNDSDLVICGTDIVEFNDNGEKSKRSVPRNSNDIKSYAKLRNPMNHVTVMFKKNEILSVGSYDSVLYFEDYYLWLKCIKAEYRMINIGLVGALVRGGQDMLRRRQGWQYVRYEWHFIYKSYKSGLVSFMQFSQMLLFRIPTRLLGTRILGLLYKFLRS